MELLLRRDQKSGMMGMGSVTFVLEVRARLTSEEQKNIARYKLGKSVLYTKGELVERGSGLLGLATRLAFKAMNISVSVDDLSGGKRIECKDIVEMIAVEGQIREAATTFKQVLETAAQFGGEEVLAI
jgi:hypothetical protein